MKHLLSAPPSTRRSSFNAGTRLPRFGLPLVPLALSMLLGCPFGAQEGDEDFYEDSDSTDAQSPTYSSQSSTSPSSSNPAARSSSATYMPASSSNTQPSAGTGNTASGARESAANAATESAANAAVCGSDCPSESYRAPYITRCAGSPSQGPCYCAAALTYYCFYDKGCYRENGAATSLTEDDLSLGLVGEVQKSEDLGYDCKLEGEGFSLNLNEYLAPFLNSSDDGVNSGADDGSEEEPEEEDASDEEEDDPNYVPCPPGAARAVEPGDGSLRFRL